MTRLFAGLLASGLLLMAGCVTTDAPISAVPGSAFGFAPTPANETKVNFAPPSLDMAARVDAMGTRIRVANPQLAFKPQYLTIGSPQPEIFHRGVSEILITEGLAKECKTDAQLAAVISMELGRMVAERMAEPGPSVRDEPPIELRVGNDGGGSFGDADQLRRAEMATYKKQERQRMRQAASMADPKSLAATILQRAGFAPADLDSASQILEEASNNRTLAKQVLNAPPLKVN
jgi:hypothetical protein